MSEQTSIFDTQTQEVEIIGEIDSATGKITYYDKATKTIKVEISRLDTYQPIKSNKPIPKPLKTSNLTP